MKILITGLPGSGKTTQAKKLASELNLCFIKTGEILREMVGSGTDIGKRLKEQMEKGELVDDWLVADIVKKSLADERCKGGFVMDGYPRSMEQLKLFDPKYDVVFYLIISESEVRGRLKFRGREDDTSEVIEKRITVQKKEIEQVLGYFKQVTRVVEIDGQRTEEAVHAQIRGLLE